MIIEIIDPHNKESLTVVKSVQEFLDYKHNRKYVLGIDKDGYKYFQDGTGLGFCALKALHSELSFKDKSLFNCKNYKNSRYDQTGISEKAQEYLVSEIERDFSKQEANDYLERYNELINRRRDMSNDKLIKILELLTVTIDSLITDVYEKDKYYSRNLEEIDDLIHELKEELK